MSPFADEEPQGFSSLWWLVMLFGVAVLGVGVFFVASPHETLTTFTVIAGILLLVDGVVAIVASIFRRGEGRGMLALIGVLSAVAGLVLIKKPFDTLLVFVLIFGVWLIVAGVVRFVAAFGEPDGRAGNIAIAIFDFVAGIVILSVPGPSLATLAVIIGIVLIFRGALWIGAGWELRGLGHKVDSELRARPAT
ncbi:MAG TPA: HdeD family acid-resistance protein [Solirubrobacteraceae bacterium]|nr:HdeD family acid-resistance protein [Solirubrobacteraceae bacterium]